MFHRTLFLLALALAAATAQAASVEVVLHTREGRPVSWWVRSTLKQG